MEVERENQMELNIFSVKFNQNNIKAYNQDSCPAFTGKNIKPAVKTVALGTTTALAYLGVNQTNKKENAFINKFLNERDDVKSAEMLLKKYPELYWLTNDVNATPEGKSSNNTDSISKFLFGKKHIEFDRTMAGIQCLKYVLNNDYESFTQCQNDEIKLTPDNFEELRNYTLSVLKTPEDVDAMLAYTVINDLGKIKNFVSDVEGQAGIKAKDHDEALLIGLKYMPQKIPSFNRLSQKYQKEILNALEADFNLGQFVFAECLEGNLTKFKNVTPEAKQLYIVHLLYDVAGVAGHINPKGSLVMTNPVYNSYMQGIESINELNSKSENEVYDSFLMKKANDFGLPMRTPKERAIVKLILMSRLTKQEDLINVKKAFDELDTDTKNNLIEGLSKDGIKNGGTLLYYAPAFIQNTYNAKLDNKTALLKKTFEVLALIYNDNESNASGIKTVSLANIANAIKNSPDLKTEQLYQIYKKEF